MAEPRSPKATSKKTVGTAPPKPPVNADDLSITPELRADRQQFLDRMLNRAPLKGPWHDPTEVISLHGPPSVYVKPETDDPVGEAAVALMQKLYPQLFAGVPAITIGKKLAPNILGETYDNRNIALAPSGGDFSRIADTIRHELAHVAGFGDFGMMSAPLTKFEVPDKALSAYAAGDASSDTHKDIQLRTPEQDRAYAREPWRFGGSQP